MTVKVMSYAMHYVNECPHKDRYQHVWGAEGSRLSGCHGASAIVLSLWMGVKRSVFFGAADSWYEGLEQMDWRTEHSEAVSILHYSSHAPDSCHGNS